MADYSAQPVRPDLGPVALSFETENTDVFVADEIMPIYDAMSKEAGFERIGIEVNTQLEGDIERRPRARFKEVGYGKIKDFYSCKQLGLEGVVDVLSEMSSERLLREEERTAFRLIRMVRAERELMVANATVNSTTYQAAGNLGADVGTDWDGAGTPIADITSYADEVEKNCGQRPNLLNLTRRQHRAISMNSEVSARFSTTRDNPAFMPLEILQDLIGIDKILVSNVPYNAAANGATPAMSKVWPDSKVLMAYVRHDDNVEDMQFARTFAYTGIGGGGMGTTVPLEENALQKTYAHFMTVDDKILVPEAAFVLHGVLT